MLRNPDTLESIPSPAIRQFIQQRIELMRNGEPYNPDAHGFFIVIDVDDRAETVQAETGCPLLRSCHGEAQLGDDDFIPLFEYVEAHDGFYEIVYIFNDSGFAHIVIVPDGPGIDPRLTKLCTDFA
ncbi:MAG: hypothetical protein ACR65R_16615 [Methylomicrobium sp.]